MAKQTINIGAVANDGTGDPLRTAFDKTNDNFDELYAVPAGIEEAAADGLLYARQDADWTALPNITVSTTAPGSPATGDVWIDTT